MPMTSKKQAAAPATPVRPRGRPAKAAAGAAPPATRPIA